MSSKGKRIAIIAIASVVALACVAAAILVWLHNDYQGKLDAFEHRTYRVEFTPGIEDYSPEDSTPVPIRVEGKDFEGNDVRRDILFVSNESTPIELMRGDYEITICSTPILRDGTLFDVAGCTQSFGIWDEEGEGAAGEHVSATIDEWDEADGSMELEDDVSFVSANAPKPIPPEELTEEAIADAIASLEGFGVPSEELEGFEEAAKDARQEAVDRKAREEEEARLATERAQKKEQFESELDQMQAEFESDPRTGGSMREMAQVAGERREKVDRIMSEVCSYLYEILPEGEADSLRASQRSWEAERDAKVHAVVEEFRDASGNMINIQANSLSYDLAVDRIRELLAML